MPIQDWSDEIIVAEVLDDPQFTDEMTTLSEMLADRQASVVVNLAAITFLNSSNLAKLLRLRKQTHTSGRRLLLCGACSMVWSEFQVTGLDKLFEFANDVTTALATLQLSGGKNGGKGKKKD